jgi:hypothetical protein
MGYKPNKAQAAELKAKGLTAEKHAALKKKVGEREVKKALSSGKGPSARDISIPHAGIDLHKHAKKLYKDHAPKVLAAAHKLASKGVDEVVEAGKNYIKGNTPRIVHGAVEKVGKKVREYIKKKTTV